MLSRKIIAASISGTLFVILLGFVSPDPFEEETVVAQNYLYSALSIMYGCLLFSFPVILGYGILSSIFSDIVAKFLSKKLGKENVEMIISGILHIVFGLVILPYSLAASILFFVTDRILKKQQENFHWSKAIKSFLLPFALAIVSMGTAWIVEFISNFEDYLV
ncbi:hypothetical protein [Rummeliibacillus suwonensis]|uniref:hypothetical protein n=1 Tax=Rummeliibacillus suwonensis TaxID=1306154 RepID=UPI0011B7E082|nr:hypothetical protein [Rummeliibacillus suwonensis]